MVSTSVSPVGGGITGATPCARVQWLYIAGISSGNVGILPWDDVEMVATAAEGPLAVKDGRCSSIAMD